MMEFQYRLATFAYYVFKIEPPVANDDITIPRNIVAVGFNFDVAGQRIDPSINCPYYDLAQEFGYKPRLALTPSEHLMCVNASRNNEGELISIVQAQRNIQRFRLFMVRNEEKTDEPETANSPEEGPLSSRQGPAGDGKTG